MWHNSLNVSLAFTSLCLCLSLRLSVSAFRLFFSVSVCVSLCLSVCLSLSLALSLPPSFSLSLCISLLNTSPHPQPLSSPLSVSQWIPELQCSDLREVSLVWCASGICRTVLHHHLCAPAQAASARLLICSPLPRSRSLSLERVGLLHGTQVKWLRYSKHMKGWKECLS